MIFNKNIRIFNTNISTFYKTKHTQNVTIHQHELENRPILNNHKHQKQQHRQKQQKTPTNI